MSTHSGRTPLFTFALFGDTHINPQDGVSGSPWSTNRLANDRARWVAAALNEDAPAFAIHMGDMVHPVPSQPGFGEAVERYRSIVGSLSPELYCVPGNHDLGDKAVDWMPAQVVNPGFIAAYQEAFGALYRSFQHQGCHFILHASPILDSGLPEDEAQWEWLEADLIGHREMRIFFITHYPLFLHVPDEPEHYDNSPPRARARLLALLREHGVEAVFSAHVHTVFHFRHERTWHHVVPAVSAIRLDYSHLFKAPPLPGQDHGRDDNAKLGYYLIDVFAEGGYGIRWRRSYGACLAEGVQPELPGLAGAIPIPDLIRASPLTIGADLRQGWAQTIIIPYTGVVDEFARKEVRNGYLVSALQEAGIRTLRVPASDLVQAEPRARMGELVELGHRFQVFCYGPPEGTVVEALKAAPQCVARLEIIDRLDTLESVLGAWKPIVSALSLPVFASKLWTSADLNELGATFSHFIGHGFAAADAKRIAAFKSAGLIDGAVYRVGAADEPAEVVSRLRLEAAGQAVLYVVMSNENPAVAQLDDAAQARRAVTSVAAAIGNGAAIKVIFDCLEDLDRGYYPRNGLYDIRFNPRPAARVLMNLASALARLPASAGPLHCEARSGGIAFISPDWMILVPDPALDPRELPIGPQTIALNLVSGRSDMVSAIKSIREPALLM